MKKPFGQIHLCQRRSNASNPSLPGESEQAFETMVKNNGACEECSRTCQLLHWSKRDLEPTVSRFFKIMIGLDFNEALFLPPKFVKNMKDLVGQETKLEDSRGICWTVTLSYYKDLLAFHKGWYEFSVDMDLKVGDLLVVNHIKGAHFVVHAFGRDGCEKLNTARKQPPIKRARINEKIAAKNTPHQITQKDARRTESSRGLVQTQPTKTNCPPNCEGENKEPCMNNEFHLMLDCDAGYVQSDCKTWLYDLSSFEMQQICSAGKIEEHIDGQKVIPDVAQESVKFQSDGDLADKSTNETVVSSMETAITSSTNIVGNNKDSGHIHNMSFERDNGHSDDLQDGLPLSAAPVRLAVIESGDMSNKSVLPQCPNRNSENEIGMVKEVTVQKMEETHGRGQKRASLPSTREEDGNSFAASERNKAGKVIQVDSPAIPTTVATSVTCLAVAATDGSAYIELPDCWPSATLPINEEERATATLEDPEGRVWGGIYHQKFGYRVLVAPWHKINAENGIQPGDHLVFSVSDATLNQIKFDIVRKQLEN